MAKQDLDDRQLDLSSVKTIVAGASVFPISVINALKEKFKGLAGPIRQVFQLTA
jgi:hypothetical protein